ncbi:hypothetical protein AQUCO_127100001v1 [Aquilegia coerulea]|uniref:Uncharacterized protein n=1 Tax=Aquilegia coerulea TaxID=218851 RepID=A0A2G5C073_AQUCA|nr:hypothetical protein AQUCO_127100001v1 [Aquilegia coerulea]
MNFTVIRSSGNIVRPSESTPSVTLNLSAIDKLPIYRIYVHSLHVYKHGDKTAAKVICEALSKALVPYYPLAGRIKETSDGELQIACTGDGAWFIEAYTDCSLESVNYLDKVLKMPKDELLPTLPPETYGINPLLRIQFTRFTCQGFVLGITMHHSTADGVGAAQIINAIGEFARGFRHPKIQPEWDREAVPPRLVRAYGETKPFPSPPIPDYQLEPAIFNISQDEINNLKSDFKELTGDYCSTFDVVVASLWCHRTRAIELKKQTKVSLIFLVNARRFLDPPLPEGFYGNCIIPVTITVSSGWLVEASNKEVVQLIRNAKARVSTKIKRWVSSDELDESGYPYASLFAYTTLCISDWISPGFDKIDYGWGPPVQMFPIETVGIIMPIAIVGLPPTPKKGIRLKTYCVHGMHLQSLQQYYKNGT